MIKTPLPSWLAMFSIPASWVYGLVICVRNIIYDGKNNVKHVPLPVIAVGNVTVGGSGKTPFVVWAVRQLRASGHTPAIVIRGYGASNPSQADEVLEYKEQLDDIDVIVGADRVKEITKYLHAGGSADCLIMDDGFQHRKLHRDLDIVVLDYLRDPFSDRVLPAGWLREPLKSLQRADAIVITHKGQVDLQFSKAIRKISGKEPISWTSHHWLSLTLHDIKESKDVGLNWLSGQSVAVRLGIGYPNHVIESLIKFGAEVNTRLLARDHKPFSTSEIDSLVKVSNTVDGIVMTLKDWVKARDVIDISLLHCPIVVPKLSLEVAEGADDLDLLLRSVFKIEKVH